MSEDLFDVKAKLLKQQREVRGLRKALRELVDANLAALYAIDQAMKGPSNPERGQRIAAICNALDVSTDLARYSGGLGIDFRKDPQAKERETAKALRGRR